MNYKYSLNHVIKSKQVKAVYGTTFSSQVGIFLVALTLALLLFGHVEVFLLAIWVTLILFSIFYRLYTLKLYDKAVKKQAFIPEYWENLFIYGVIYSAFIWGLAGVLIFPKESVTHQAFIVITITGIISASIGTLAPILKAQYIFIPITIIPVMTSIFLTNNEFGFALMSLVLLFIIFSFVSGYNFNQRVIENIKLNFNSVRSKNALEKSEKRYRLLYEKSEDPMFLFNGSRFSMINNAAVKLFGYDSIKHILSIPAFNLSPIFQPNNIKSIDKAKHIFKIIETKGHYNTEWTCKHINGHYFPVEVTLTLIPYENHYETFCVFRDISSKKKLEKELILAQLKSEEAKRKSDEASNAKSDFLANMSHEIRTPMNGVIGTTAILLKTDLNQQQLNYAHTIRNSASSMLTIINDILDYSKIEAGMFDIDSHPFNMKDLVKQFTSSIINKFNEKELKLIVKLDHKMDRWYLGDSGRIRQIFTNLVGNALKFTETGSIILQGKIVNVKDNISQIKFEIIDTGIGISIEKQKKIFERFTQADTSTTRKYGGTGLGLSICKQLSTLMGGDIGFKSEINKGTNFWFTFELGFCKKPSSLTQKLNNENLRQFQSKILIVEDNKTNQMVAEGMLKLFGVKVDIVENGKQSLAKLEKNQYDLVFMDCHMPILDGYKATQEIRRKKSTVLNPKIPIVAMTASAMQGDREKCIAYGMNDYITKPVDLRELEDILHKWLSKMEFNSPVSQADTNKDNRSTHIIKPNIVNTIVKHSTLGEEVLLFDFESLYSRLSGDIILVKTIIKKFIPSMLTQVNVLNEDIENKDIKKIISSAHKLKGSSATVGCMQLSNFAYIIEAAGKKKNFDTINETSKVLMKSYLDSKQAIEDSLFKV